MLDDDYAEEVVGLTGDDTIDALDEELLGIVLGRTRTWKFNGDGDRHQRVGRGRPRHGEGDRRLRG